MKLRNFVTAVLLGCALLLGGAPSFAQENNVSQCATRATCVLASGLSWSAGNQVWIFTPISPNASILIYIHNNNPTNAHTTQTINVFQTESTLVNSLLSNADQWAQDAVKQNSVAGASCNSVNANAKNTPGASGKGTCYVVGMFAAQVAVQITGASSAAGNPDTFDLVIVQSTGYPGGPQPGQDDSSGASTVTAAISGQPIQVDLSKVNGSAVTLASGLVPVGIAQGSAASDGMGNGNVTGIDAYNASSTTPMVGGTIFNGTTWDRQRAAPGTTGVTGVNTEGTKATYAANASITAFAGDEGQLCGSGTKTIRLVKLGFYGVAAAAAGDASMSVNKRSTADTGGTPNVISGVPLDANSAAATATFTAYTAAPTPGTQIGAIMSAEFPVVNITTTALNYFQFYAFGSNNEQSIVLRGTAQCIALSRGGALITGESNTLNVVWTEE